MITVITPTILRPTLKRTCESVPEDWQHIVIPNWDGDYGNKARNKAFSWVKGEYILYLDDDDYYLPEVKAVIEEAVKDKPLWGLFPAIRYGQRFLNLPPERNKTTSNQFFYRTDLNLPYPKDNFLENNPYLADATLIEQLARFPYKVLDTPLVVIEKSNYGV